MTPDLRSVSISIEGNPTGQEAGWVEIAFKHPSETAANWMAIDPAKPGADRSVELEFSFRPNWPGIWHLMAIMARPL